MRQIQPILTLLVCHQNETYIRTEDIVELLKEQGRSIAMVLLGGLQFYTGQLFDIETITRAAQQYVSNRRLSLV
jgi:kynureninase